MISEVNMANKKIVIDLNSSEGNAFYILSMFRKYLRLIGLDNDKIEQLMADAKSSDYDHLLDVVKKNSSICFKKSR